MTLWSKMKGTERFEMKWAEGPLGDHAPQKEYRFHPTRRWRLDYAWPDQRVAVEVHGFGFGHQTLKQMSVDREKVREAILRGWRVLEFTSRCLGSHEKVEEAVVQTCLILSGGTIQDDIREEHS